MRLPGQGVKNEEGEGENEGEGDREEDHEDDAESEDASYWARIGKLLPASTQKIHVRFCWVKTHEHPQESIEEIWYSLHLPKFQAK